MRGFYKALITLHPSSFADRFGEEMLWIFDAKDPEYSSFALILDGLLSLLRQWVFHSTLWAFGVSILINCFVFQKMIESFVLDVRRLLASMQ